MTTVLSPKPAPPLPVIIGHVLDLYQNRICRAAVEAALIDLRPDPTTVDAWACIGDCIVAVLDRVETGDIKPEAAAKLLRRVFQMG